MMCVLIPPDLFQKLPLCERPLLLRLIAGPDPELLTFVLKENETGEVEVRKHTYLHTLSHTGTHTCSIEANLSYPWYLIFLTIKCLHSLLGMKQELYRLLRQYPF